MVIADVDGVVRCRHSVLRARCAEDADATQGTSVLGRVVSGTVAIGGSGEKRHLADAPEMVELSVIGVTFSDTVANALRVRLRHTDDASEVVGRRVIAVELSGTVLHGTERLTPALFRCPAVPPAERCHGGNVQRVGPRRRRATRLAPR